MTVARSSNVSSTAPPGVPRERPEAADDDARVGARLRQLREARGLSARELARLASISPAYLSRLENGKVSPTVATLGRVVQAMDETIATLFDETRDDGLVVRAHERRAVRSRGVDDYRVTPSWATRLEVLESVVAPGQGSGPTSYNHPGDEECVLVLDGELDVVIEGEVYRLGTGDSATFPCKTPHHWRNPSTQVSRVLWIITPVLY